MAAYSPGSRHDAASDGRVEEIRLAGHRAERVKSGLTAQEKYVSKKRVHQINASAVKPADRESRSKEQSRISDLPSLIESSGTALAAPDLARILGLGRTVIYQMASDGRLPHYRIGTIIRFDPFVTAEWLRQRLINAA